MEFELPMLKYDIIEPEEQKIASYFSGLKENF